jgi:phosphate-selective porin OprO/OprP
MATKRTMRSVLRHAGLPFFLAALALTPLPESYGAGEQSSHDFLSAEPADPVVVPISWDEPVATSGSSEVAGDEVTALAKRVEELERYIRDQDRIRTAAGQEESAPAAESDAPKDTCKELEPIVKPTFTPSGRIYFDGVTYDDDDDVVAFFNTDRDNEVGFRTFRLGGRGNIWENLAYSVEVEFRGGPNAITFKDIYMEQQNIPHFGNFRAGHFKEPLGLEEFGSDKFNTFMEKSPATQAFCPSRNFGVMIWDNCDPCDEAAWFVGLFRADSPDAPATNTGLWRSDEDDWSFDTRFAFLPYYDDPSEGRYLVHLGGSYSFRHIDGISTGASGNQNVAYSTLNGLAEFTKRSWVGSQGPIGFGAEADSDQWNQLNAEFLVIWGATSVQSEYFQVLMNSGETFQGGYAFLSYFLTGESRAYRKEDKTIDRLIPFEPFFWVDTCKSAGCGRGAWELAIGYSWVDLEDGHDTVATIPATAANRRRGFNSDVVVGLNWYHNPWSRITFNYEYEMVDFVDGGVPDSDANIFGVRWQVDW